jgi:alpha-beta hydrolase superfamily lysophospholipase
MAHFAELGYEAHAISLPGHGLSGLRRRHINLHTFGDYVEVLSDAVDQFAKKPVVIGHSMGGGIVQKYLERHQLPGAVLMAPTPARGVWGMMLRNLFELPLVLLKSSVLFDTHCFVETAPMAGKLLFNENTTLDIEAFQKRLHKESFLAGVGQLFAYARLNLERTSMLVMAGANDRIFTVKEQRLTAERYGAELFVYENMPHNLMIEIGWERVANDIHTWLSRAVR